MSIGNLKDQGNKGNNFPFQLKALKLAGKELGSNLQEIVVTQATTAALLTSINAVYTAYPSLFLVSKSIVYNSTANNYSAFLTLATVS
jgi:hypothetical protein